MLTLYAIERQTDYVQLDEKDISRHTVRQFDQRRKECCISAPDKRT